MRFVFEDLGQGMNVPIVRSYIILCVLNTTRMGGFSCWRNSRISVYWQYATLRGWGVIRGGEKCRVRDQDCCSQKGHYGIETTWTLKYSSFMGLVLFFGLGLIFGLPKRYYIGGFR